jgi:hypothetical protein
MDACPPSLRPRVDVLMTKVDTVGSWCREVPAGFDLMADPAG